MRTVSPVDRGPDQCVGKPGGWCEKGDCCAGGAARGEGKGEMGIERGSWFMARMWVFNSIERDSWDSEGS
jgi:hypothetical protein